MKSIAINIAVSVSRLWESVTIEVIQQLTDENNNYLVSEDDNTLIAQ